MHEQISHIQLDNQLFKCICELCDCGHHRKHNDCNLFYKGAGKMENMTHYRQIYKTFQGFKPRGSFKPPPERYITPRTSMERETLQRSDYKELDLSVKAKSFKKSGYPFPKAQMFFNTKYNEDFIKKDYIPTILCHPATTQKFYGKFSDKTTHKEEFPTWNIKRVKPVPEYPVLAHLIMYPSISKSIDESLMRASYPGASMKRKFYNYGKATLKPEGERYMQTEQKNAYKEVEISLRSTLRPPSDLKFQGKLLALTKYQSDYPEYGKQPLPPKSITPPPAMIKLNIDNL